jgi:hypothetical protein
MRKGQADIVTFMILAVVIVIIAPVVMMIFNTSVQGFTAGFNSIDNSTANQMATMNNNFNSMYDLIVISVFIVNIILMFITAFLVEVHPAFLVFYIFTCVFAMIFIPATLTGAEGIWGANVISGYTNYLPATQFILDNYGSVMLVVMVITGIITYAKLRGGQNNY